MEARPLVTPGAPRSSLPREREPRPERSATRGGAGTQAASRGRSGSGVRVRRLARGTEDGFSSRLVPGLRSSADAERLADELAFAATRLEVLAAAPPGLYAEIADASVEREERAWLAFLVAYLGPLEDDDPFASIAAARTSWASGEPPRLEGVELGPRAAHDPRHGMRTITAYRVWARRAGSQQAAYLGEPSWTPERRFARVFERLSLPGLHRDARFDLLVTLGVLGVFELAPAALQLGGANETTLAAKRALGIGDSLLLERRAVELAEGVGVPLAALDVGLFNWGRGTRATLGLDPGVEPDEDRLAEVRVGLGL